MNYYVWVGPREIDCKGDRLFSNTICYYSDNNPQNKRKANIYGETINQFIEQKMQDILHKYPNAKFVFYNPRIAYFLHKKLRSHVECLNELQILDLLNDKIYTRFWIGRFVSVLPSILVDSGMISFQDLEDSLGAAEKYILQRSKSSGGLGTFILTKYNDMLSKLKDDYHELFIASPYISNAFAINVNAIIGNEKIIVFPPSLQLSEQNDDRILFHGADYVGAKGLSVSLMHKLKLNTSTILNRVKMLGYRGIIGVDFLVTRDDIYFLEFNPRYQASSFLINMALRDQKLVSLTEMNIMAFNGDLSGISETEFIEIPYSYYKYLFVSSSQHLFNVYNNATPGEYIYEVINDGWYPGIPTEKDAYCFSIIFHTNIASINPDYICDIYPNINGQESFLKKHLHTDIGLKIALLNQGCVIQESAISYLRTKGIIKKAVFNAIDFRLANGLPINAPVNIKLSELSPFTVRYVGDKLRLFYYSEELSEINIEMQPKWTDYRTRNDIPYSRIAYLSTDRLRMKHEPVCFFKQRGSACQFCNLPEKPMSFQQDDFEEVLDNLIKKPTFRHIMLGGGSGVPEKESEQIIAISKMIRERDREIPIYLMCLPPKDTNILQQYRNAGITEIAFNIEIWNRERAQKIMPGKGQIPLDHYLDMLKSATDLWGENGDVRTALIVGLDQTDNLFTAIKMLSSNGIQPMLSVFRPIPGTRLELLSPPDNQTLLHIYQEAQEICEDNHMELGPKCKECRNNMLAL